MRSIIFLLLLSASCTLRAQIGFQAIPEFKKRSANQFTSDWQYLSTDILLFNSQKFNALVNDIAARDPNMMVKKKKGPQEVIEYLFIKARIPDVKYFGGDLEYPIYNFRVSQDASGAYTTQVSDDNEIIQIIDNLPLASVSDHVEAFIEGEAITNKNSNDGYFIQMVSRQLTHISKIANPSMAIMSLVGEFGKFLDSQASKTQYKFSTRIRIYEDDDFNKRLHSVNIYVLAPTGTTETGFGAAAFEALLDTARNMNIDRKLISSTIKYDRYPFLVFANYKSKYISEQVIGDQIDFEYIEARRQKIQRIYDEKVINEETYRQEMKFLEFLTAFANLKLDVELYTMNYQNAVMDDFSRSLFIILQKYRGLKNIYKTRLAEFKGNSLFSTDFKSQYESILLNTELYLDRDNNLKNVKNLVNTLYEFENEQVVLDSKKREDYLSRLYAVEMPQNEANDLDVKDVNNLIARLEQELYAEVYEKDVRSLKTLEANDTNLERTEELKRKVRTTNCQYCREKVNEALTDFGTRYETYQLGIALQEVEPERDNAKEAIYYALVKENCFTKNLTTNYPDSVPMPAHVKMLKDEADALAKKREELQNLRSWDAFDRTRLAAVTKYIDDLQQNASALRKGFESLCDKMRILCDCPE